MRKSIDPLGGLLVMEGVLSEDQLADVLETQRDGFAIASVAYLLGYASEEELVRTLSRQVGTPGALLERCIISLHNLQIVPREIALRYTLLPLYVDSQHVFVGIADLSDPGVLNELAIITGKMVIPHVTLQICMARAIRECYALLDSGAAYWFGTLTSIEDLNDPQGLLTPVLDVDDLPPEVEAAPLDVTDPNLAVPVNPEDIVSADDMGAAPDPDDEELDLGSGAPLPEPRRILLVDPDPRARSQIADILSPEGHSLIEAESGVEAVKHLRADAPDLAIIEVMLPKIQGYQLCRSIKSSRRYGDIPVILITGSEAAGKRNRELMEQYGADEVLAKPLNQSELVGRINNLLARPRTPRALEEADREHFESAIELYRKGQAEEAVEALREALEIDPLSARSHFVLGNILQHLERTYEAIDAYEQTTQLRPDYFPALSRLAFLYYKRGFLAKALSTWRRSLEHCDDPEQAKRISTFMAKLVKEMEKRGSGVREMPRPGSDESV